MNALHTMRPLLTFAARRALAARFDHEAIDEMIDSAFAEYDLNRPELPAEPSTGGQMMVHLACLTIGLYRTLLRRGFEPAEARAVVAAVTARVYYAGATVPDFFARLVNHSPAGRVRAATQLFRSFPFSAPSYVMADVHAEPDVIAFDVRRCPVAEYFRRQGLGDLCVATWCNLDYALARQWGARLERTKTLAAGDDHCDFRWCVENQRQESTHEAA